MTVMDETKTVGGKPIPLLLCFYKSHRYRSGIEPGVCMVKRQ